MGVRIKYLGAIPIRKMMWQEIREVRSVAWSGQWLFFSKSSLEGLNYSQIIKQKDIIQIAYREKVVKIVQNYCAEIIGMPDNA